MNNAGRIGFLIKGEYDNTVTYDFLDVVYYNGASYVAKKPTIGNAPARNNEYWQIFAEGGTLTENSDISDTTVAFTEAESRVNVASGEKMSVLFAKVKKWLSDLKPHAFFVPVNDLTSTDSSLALAATQGNALRENIESLQNELGELGTAVNRFGEFGVADVVTLYGYASLQKLSGGKCNIMLNFKVTGCSDTNTSQLPISKPKICSLLGINNFTHDWRNAVAIPNQRWLSSGIISEGQSGFGMTCANYASALALGRPYTKDGTFGSYASNSAYFTIGTVWTIFIFGASYS